jgi:hypothetical protein
MGYSYLHDVEFEKYEDSIYYFSIKTGDNYHENSLNAFCIFLDSFVNIFFEYDFDYKIQYEYEMRGSYPDDIIYIDLNLRSKFNNESSFEKLIDDNKEILLKDPESYLIKDLIEDFDSIIKQIFPNFCGVQNLS